MKRKLFVGALMALMVIVSQCSKETDEDAIRALIEADSVWFNTSSEVDSTSDNENRDTLVIWWRGPQTHDDPFIDINVIGDSAWVAYSRGNFGDLIVLAFADSVWNDWSKDLSETAMIRATFLRTGSETDEHRGWQLNTISLAEGMSDDNTVRIDSVRITTPTEAMDILITAPLNTYFKVDSLITFAPAESVTVTLYTNVADGHAFLHTFILAWPYYIRLPFTNLGGGVHQGTWQAQLIAFPRFAIFDLMSHSTLYTPDQPYDFHGWLLPYTISQ